ncbi:metallopeptidase family protein [Salipiger sp. P9]|uniref:metallopeptidase family protein n=1 Tax=Salipiger pentaromativorans TaxID=2943193 RepID=UPI002157BA55|nr:metallopeptidase family protein [Salipiger pentaromativorans]MCR8548834.1 metallopeptidase family protein [Salipiger pentaromativorans]
MSDPDLAAFERMARAALAQFPAPFRDSAAEVVLQVVDWPPKKILHEMRIADPLELTGLYEGIPMTERSLTFPSPYPDRVWLFRLPILAEWRDRGDIALEDLVTHVTVHEFAHHFGWSDDDIASIDRWWE